MRVVSLQVATTIGDLAGLPEGTRIATNHNKLMILGRFAGQWFWYEDGELVNYQPLVHWLPCIILPPVVDRALEEATERVQEILGAEVLVEKERLHQVDLVAVDDDEPEETPEQGAE